MFHHLGKQTVTEAKRLKLGALRAYAVRLAPASKGARFPVACYINGDMRARDVEGSGLIHLEGRLITSLEVDVSRSGGVAGDVWDVWVEQDATGHPGERFLTTPRGVVRTAPQGAEVLFCLDSHEDATAWRELADLTTGRAGAPLDVYVTPGAPRKFSTPRELTDTTWDVSAFRHVLFTVEQLAANGGHPVVWSNYVDVLTLPDSRALHWSEPMGSLNNLGAPGAVAGWTGGQGRLWLGAPADLESEHARHVRALMPAARFRLRFGGGELDKARLGRNADYWARVSALGW